MNNKITEAQKKYILDLLNRKDVMPKRFEKKFGFDISQEPDSISQQLEMCSSLNASKIIDYLKERNPKGFKMYRRTVTWAKKNKIKGVRNKLTKGILREKIYVSGITIPDDIREYLDTTDDDDYSEDYEL